MNKVMGRKRDIALFVLPAFIIYAVFALFPIFYNIYLSLFKTDLMSPGIFVGLKNYIDLLKDGTFIHAFKNNILMVIGSLIAHMPLAMFFGNAIFKKIKGAAFFQTVFFLPCVICGVAVGLTWTFIYNGNYGLLNALLKLIGLGSLQQMWLANKHTAMICIIVVIMWQYVGYHMVIQLAAMRNIDLSFYEAAEMDGATSWQQFKYITFPLIKPILRIDAVLIITGSLKYYDLVAVMTSGGPNHATEVMSTYMYYQSFNILHYGYASAIGVILMLLCMLSVGASNRIFKTDDAAF
jgi:raffinose/stachyose/melibiose transport system permease protein